MYSKAIRIGGLAAILGGIMLIVHSVGAASMPRGCIGDVECAIRPMRDTGVFGVFFLLALPLLLAGMASLALRARKAGRFGRLGLAGVILGSAAVATLSGAIVAQTFFFGGDFPLMPYFVIPGELALLVGFTLVGIAVLRGGVLPRWTSALLVVSTIVMLWFNDQNAFVLLGIPFALAWMTVGYILLSGRRDAIRQTTQNAEGGRDYDAFSAWRP